MQQGNGKTASFTQVPRLVGSQVFTCSRADMTSPLCQGLPSASPIKIHAH